MARLIAYLLAGATVLAFAGAAAAEDDAEAHLSDLAACAQSSDQAICLVQVAKRRPFAVPAEDEPDFAYAPEVVIAIKSGTPAKTSRLQMLMADRMGRPQKAASQALRADLNGTDPATALAQMDLTSSSPDMRRRLDESHPFAEEAYAAIVLAACQPIAPDRNHRPSTGLVSAALDRWKTEAAAGGGAEADDIVRRCARSGRRDIVMSATQSIPDGSIEVARALLDSGLADEAVRRLKRAVSAKSPDPFAGSLEVSELIPTLVEHGDGDTARAVAWAILVRSQKELASSSKPDVADFDDVTKTGMLSVGSRLLVDQDTSILASLVDYGFKSDARAWAERFDTSGRNTGYPSSAYLASIAAAAWKMLDEPDRAGAITSVWRRAAGGRSPDCSEQTPACIAAKGAEVIVSLANRAAIESGHGDPDTLAPLLGAGNIKGILAGRKCHTREPATVEGLIGDDADPLVRAVALISCSNSAIEAGNLDLAVEAVTRRAAIRDADLKLGIFQVPDGAITESGAIALAAAAANAGRLDLMHRMVDLVFQVATRAPADELDDLEDLQKIAIAELREQGRL